MRYENELKYVNCCPAMMSPFRTMRGLALAIQCAVALHTGLPFVEELRNPRLPASWSDLSASSSGAPDPAALYPAHTVSVPVDHFPNETRYEPHTSATFPLRYWFDARHFRPGGPVIVLAAGETSGVDRLPFMQKGIVAHLAAATHGLAVVLEHRYYGSSWPVDNLTTESLRFLTTEQALADTVYFAKHVKFPGLEDVDLTAPNTAYLAYGGSYAGAFVAFLRKLYPMSTGGAISSSGVTEAIVDYWEYFEAARLFAPKGCAVATQKLTHAIDRILLGADEIAKKELMRAFGLANLTHHTDFVNVLTRGILGLQETNWDPTLTSPQFGRYCGNVTSDTLLYSETAGLNDIVRQLLVAGGYKQEVGSLTARMLNYIGYINVTAVSRCRQTQDECFTRYNETFFRQDDITQGWRAWSYQVCTQWGYFQTGSGAPRTQLPLVSRLIDLPFSSLECEYAFNITTPPDVDSINRLGGFDLSYPRLAIIDGEADPWRAATPHKIGIPDRISTVSEPFLLIRGGVHHWDENGLFKNETEGGELPPKAVREVQSMEVEFVKSWMEGMGKLSRI